MIISWRSSSRRLGQVVDQGMRNGKGVHTIRGSHYHRETGAEKMWGGGGGLAANASKIQ